MDAPSTAAARSARPWLFALLLVVCTSILGGCAAFAPPRPFTTEAEALAARGEPTRRWQNEDGTTTLEYATQPYGHTCLMVQVDAGGIVLRQWDALDGDNLARVTKGMTRDEVSRLLGQHRSEQFFKLSGEEVWDWNIRNEYGASIATLFNVHFIDGKVVRTSQTYVYPPDGAMWGPWGHPYPFGYPYPLHPRFHGYGYWPYWW
ncbi:hypothetical protein [Thauera sinica]|uniref:Outer membrane protein assembly factor BamE n=1 Tax=Thauera sinica TaxID=2665146 RepID=A0ABW1ARU0_9RHOO|nr:hypothetical protein [Thauera sp. K11]ATE61489.1 hypothetical protein CCZ27_17385 [Thauera sp. K11]